MEDVRPIYERFTWQSIRYSAYTGTWKLDAHAVVYQGCIKCTLVQMYTCKYWWWSFQFAYFMECAVLQTIDFKLILTRLHINFLHFLSWKCLQYCYKVWHCYFLPHIRIHKWYPSRSNQLIINNSEVALSVPRSMLINDGKQCSFLHAPLKDDHDTAHMSAALLSLLCMALQQHQ